MNPPIRIVVLSLFLSACATTGNDASEECDILAMLEGKSCVDPDHEEIAKHPLGSEGNPVRAAGPPGEREYIMRLRCLDGSDIVGYERAGSVGEGPYGFILDLYYVHCGVGDDAKKHEVYMDMYHNGYRETEPVEGLLIDG